MKKVIFSIIVFLVSISFVNAKDITLKNNYEINNKKAIIINLNKENVKKAPVIKIAQTLEEKQKEIEEEIQSYTRGLNDLVNNFKMDECKAVGAEKCQKMITELKNKISSATSVWNTRVDNYINQGYFSGQNIVIEEYREAVNKANEFIKNAAQDADTNLNLDTNIDFNNFCNEEGVHKTVKFLGYGLYIVKIMVPILLIIFGSIDFGKAIVSSNQDAIQKTSKILIIRIIIGIVIFLLPTIINYVFKIAGNDENAFKNCRIDRKSVV